MATASLIIDSVGLPHAAGYYQVFPHEPSPAGELNFDVGKIISVTDKEITMLRLLDELVKVGTSGTVVIVCHAEKNGMRVRLADGGTFASRDALDVIENADSAFARATAIRKMPETSPKEKQDKKNAWQSLSERLSGFSVLGKDLSEASNDFDKWFDGEAQRLKISANDMKSIFTKAATVRNLHLDRVELRACNIGGSLPAMGVLKKFLGCKKLLAPRCTTIFMNAITIESIEPLELHPSDPSRTVHKLPGGASRPRGGPWHPHRVPGPIGSKLNRTTDVVTLKGGTLVPGRKREFFNGRSYMAISVWEIEPFKFIASAAAPRPAKSTSRSPIRGPDWTQEPDWNQVAEVARSLFMFSGGNYKGKLFPFAGFWDPPASSFPWLVPNEKEYVSLIMQA